MKKFNPNAIAIILVAVALVVSGFYILRTAKNDKQKPATATNGAQTNGIKSPDADYDVEAVINYDGSNFTPNSVEIDLGSVKLIEKPIQGKWLKITNNSTSTLEVYSDNPDLNIGLIAPGEFKITNVTRKGTWRYYNHLKPSQGGTVRLD